MNNENSTELTFSSFCLLVAFNALVSLAAICLLCAPEHPSSVWFFKELIFTFCLAGVVCNLFFSVKGDEEDDDDDLYTDF